MKANISQEFEQKFIDIDLKLDELKKNQNEETKKGKEELEQKIKGIADV